MVKFTYVAASNATTNSTNLEARDEASGAGAGRDVYVKKILFGAPADGDRTMLHDARTQPGHASGMGSVAVGEVAWNFTQPTAAAGINRIFEVDFTSGGSQGLRLDGGSIHTNGARTTVIWEPVDEQG